MELVAFTFVNLFIICVCLVTLVSLSGRNLIILLLVIELLFFSAAMLMLAYSVAFFGAEASKDAMVYSAAIIIVAAGESAITLALTAKLHKEARSILIK